MEKGIVVSGVGEVRAAPDILAVTIEVETRASTVAAARTANAEAAARLIASLKAEGVDQRDIQTANLSVRAEYDRPDSGNPRVSGYRVTNSLRVLLRDTEKAGAIIDAALDAAGDDGRLGGLRFDFSDPAPLYAQARIRACIDAREKALALASGMAVKLGKLVSVVENAAETQRQPSMLAAAMRMESLPVEAGESAVSVGVTAHFAIKG